MWCTWCRCQGLDVSHMCSTHWLEAIGAVATSFVKHCLCTWQCCGPPPLLTFTVPLASHNHQISSNLGSPKLLVRDRLNPVCRGVTLPGVTFHSGLLNALITSLLVLQRKMLCLVPGPCLSSSCCSTVPKHMCKVAWLCNLAFQPFGTSCSHFKTMQWYLKRT